jgi:hypothetical protein
MNASRTNQIGVPQAAGTGTRAFVTNPDVRMRLKLLSCEVFRREIRAAAVRSPNHLDVEFLEEPPHQLSEADMVQRIQSVVDQADRSNYHAVLVVNGSCKQGLSGLQARTVPLVVPRAKDCISLLLETWTPRRQSVSTPPLQHNWRGETLRGTKNPLALAQARRWNLPLAGALPLSKESGWQPSDLQSRYRYYGLLSKAAARGSKRCGLVSLIDLLVDGYWNYTEFLVVAPGWRVVVDEHGSLNAEGPL